MSGAKEKAMRAAPELGAAPPRRRGSNELELGPLRACRVP